MDTNPLRPSWDNSMAIDTDSYPQVGCWKKNKTKPKPTPTQQRMAWGAYTINYYPQWDRKIAITDWTYREGAHTCSPTHCLAADVPAISTRHQKVISSPLWGSLKAFKWIHGRRFYQGLLNTETIQPSKLKIAVSMTRAWKEEKCSTSIYLYFSSTTSFPSLPPLFFLHLPNCTGHFQRPDSGRKANFSQ